MARTARTPEEGEVAQPGRGNGEQGADSGAEVSTIKDAMQKSEDRIDPATGKPLDMTEAHREGNRETVSPGQVDKIWTEDSKDRWGNHVDADGNPVPQPDLTDMLKEQRETEAVRAEAEANR